MAALCASKPMYRGTLLGTVEGLSYLALPLGFEALAPRLKTFFTTRTSAMNRCSSASPKNERTRDLGTQ
eukprot:jgi/Pico_ML_1/51896/g26.t1